MSKYKCPGKECEGKSVVYDESFVLDRHTGEVSICMWCNVQYVLTNLEYRGMTPPIKGDSTPRFH